MPKRIDLNQKLIVKALRERGVAVQSLAPLGKGAPDLLVAHKGLWHVVEVKNGDKPPSKQRLTLAEEEWHRQFSSKAPVHVWTSLEDALRTLGMWEI